MSLAVTMAAQVLSISVGRWLADTQAPTLIELHKVIGAALNAIETAKVVLADAEKQQDIDTRNAMIDSANTLVAQARGMVTDAASKAAMAIPNEVLEGFERWDDAMVEISDRIVKEAKSTVLTLFGIGVGGVVVYALLRRVL